MKEPNSKCNLLIALCFSFGWFILTSCNNHNSHIRLSEEEVDSIHMNYGRRISAKADSIEVIDLNEYFDKTVDITSSVTDVKIIPLETSDESIIGTIYKIIYTDDYIYIVDHASKYGVVIFDANGNFIKRIPWGNGPGELFKVQDISYDYQRNELIVYQHYNIYRYSKSGSYIESQKTLIFPTNIVAINDEYLIIKTYEENAHLNSDCRDCSLFITDRNFSLKYISLNKWDKTTYTNTFATYIRQNNNAATICMNFNDTIWRYEDHTFKAKYVLDYNSKRLDLQVTDDFYTFAEKTEKNCKFFFIGEYLENKSSQMVLLRNRCKKGNLIAYRDKNSGKIIGGTDVLINCNLLPFFGTPISTYNDYFVSYFGYDEDLKLCEMSEKLNEKDKEVIKNMDIEDNPMLLLYKVKIND